MFRQSVPGHAARGGRATGCLCQELFTACWGPEATPPAAMPGLWTGEVYLVSSWKRSLQGPCSSRWAQSVTSCRGTSGMRSGPWETGHRWLTAGGSRRLTPRADASGGCRPVVPQRAQQLILLLPPTPRQSRAELLAGRLGSGPAVLPGAAPGPSFCPGCGHSSPCPLPSPLHHCSLTVWLRKFCISRRPHAFRFSSGVTSYSACRVGSTEVWGFGQGDRCVCWG